MKLPGRPLGRIVCCGILTAARGIASSKCYDFLAGTLAAGLAFVRARVELYPAVLAWFLRHRGCWWTNVSLWFGGDDWELGTCR